MSHVRRVELNSVSASFSVLALTICLAAASARGDIFATGRPPNDGARLLRYAPDGRYLGLFPAAAPTVSEEFNSPTIGPDGKLYVISNVLGFGDVLRLDPATGESTFLLAPAEVQELTIPLGIAFGPGGTLYVGSNAWPGGPLGSSAAVHRYDRTARTLTPVIVPSDQDRLITNLAVGPDALIYVARAGLGADRFIERYDPVTGLRLGTVLPAADRFVFGPDGLLYAGDLSGNVVRLSPLVPTLPETFIPAGLGSMQDVADLAFGGDGYLYVNSRNASAVLRFDAVTGAFAGQFASYDRGVDGFYGVFEVAHAIPEPGTLAAAGGLLLAMWRRAVRLR